MALRDSTIRDQGVGRRVARNTAVQLAGRSVTGSLSLLTLMLLARYLGPSGMGDYLLVLSLLTLLNLSEMGLTTMAIRELSLAGSEEEESKLLGNLVMVRTVLAVAGAAVVCLAALLLGYRAEVTAAICLGSLSYVFASLGTGSIGLSFAASLRMEYQVVATAVQGLTLLALAGIVVALGLGVIAIVAAYNVSVLAGSLMTWVFSRRLILPRFQLDLALWRRLLTQSAPVTIAFVAWLAYSRIDMVMLSKMEGTGDAVGLYGMAYRFVDLLAPLNLYFVLSVYPLLVRHHEQRAAEDLRRLYQKSFDVLVLLVLPATVVLFVFPETVLTIAGSGEFRPAATSLQLLSVSVAVMAVCGLFGHVLLALGRQVELAKIMPAGLVANVVLNLVLIPRMGIEGAALSTLLTEMAVGVFLLVSLRSKLGYLPSFASAARTVLVAAGGATVALLVLPDVFVLRAAFVIAVLALLVPASGAFTAAELRARLDDLLGSLPRRAASHGRTPLGGQVE